MLHSLSGPLNRIRDTARHAWKRGETARTPRTGSLSGGRRKPDLSAGSTKLRSFHFLSSSIKAQFVRFEPIVADRNVNTFQAVVRLVRAQQNARVASARAAELEVEARVLQRMIGDQPARALLSGRFSGKLPVGGVPIHLPKRVPLVKARSLKC